MDVVITHWPPTKHEIAPRFRGDALNGYFVNDREDLVREIAPQWWICGHVHDPYECVIGTTRCLANPTGYPHQHPKRTGFYPDRTIEVEPAALQIPED